MFLRNGLPLVTLCGRCCNTCLQLAPSTDAGRTSTLMLLVLLFLCLLLLLQVGAIIADVVFGFVDQRTTFLLSAAFGLVGALVSWLFLPDTTGLSLDEIDR